MTYVAYPQTRRYHRTDGWRGYPIPRFAIIGASDTGEWSDSPCPTREVKAEIRRFQREVLRPLGIKSRQRIGVTSNVFCGKRWLVVPRGSFCTAAAAALEWMEKNDLSLQYLHTADLKELIVNETTNSQP